MEGREFSAYIVKYEANKNTNGSKTRITEILIAIRTDNI